jgi:hypothetical protein
MQMSANGPTRLYGPIETVEGLRQHLQWAVIVEFTTIPLYLTAMYSVTDKTSEVYRLIRSVVLEEMLHMNLASNLLNGIGATPKLVGQVPEFPTHLTHSAPGSPYLQLIAASTVLMSETFMAIEQPAPLTARAQSDNYSTVGQLYKAIDEGFDYCVRRYGPEAVFQDTGFQRTDWDFGYSGGRAIRVHDLVTAKRAIQEIVEQGEGAETVSQPLRPTEPWAAYEQYGYRTDGTFGPILGTPVELSHYYKFKAIAEGTVLMPSTYPMAPNPSLDNFGNPLAREVGDIFNGCYGLMVRALERALGSTDAQLYFTVVVAMMQSTLPPLAVELMRIPLSPESDATLGPTAGPPFHYDDTPLNELVKKVDVLLATLEEPSHASSSLSSLVSTLRGVSTALTETAGQVGVAL